MNIIQAIKENKIYGIVREDNTDKAIEIANAYIKGGIKVIEINSTIEAIKEVAKNEDVYIAQGGVITSSQALDGIAAGAKLLVSPILQMNLVKLSSGHKIPLMLTATTPNEAYTAWKARVPIIKIYPIKDLGGATYIEELLRPMKFLNVMPTGSIKISDIKEYLKKGATAVGLGHELYHNKTTDEIIESTKCAVVEAKSAI